LEDLSKFSCTHLGYIPTTATNPSTKTKTKLSFSRYLCPSHIPVGEAWKKKPRGSLEELGENIDTYIHTYIHLPTHTVHGFFDQWVGIKNKFFLFSFSSRIISEFYVCPAFGEMVL
jgi:hypothetical protein